MDETSLRALLERALVPEPPIGPVADHSLRAGIKLRRRRRMRAAAGGAAAIAVIAVAIPVVTGALGNTAARRTGTTAQAETVYVVHNAGWFVTPISTITNTAGKRIRVAKGAMAIAITPDGKTVYVANWRADTVTPITTATNTAGKPIKVGKAPNWIAITPNGQTAYVANWGSNTVTPITTATNTAGKPIKAGPHPRMIAITPDGKTAYVVNEADHSRLGHGDADHHGDQHSGQADQRRGGVPRDDRDDAGWEDRLCHQRGDTVTPITTATNTPGTPIQVGKEPSAIAITPDGKTAYVVNQFGCAVTPITTATNTPGTPIRVGRGPEAIAITPDGKTAYVANGELGHGDADHDGDQQGG